jgi:hypothetical protein
MWGERQRWKLCREVRSHLRAGGASWDPWNLQEVLEKVLEQPLFSKEIMDRDRHRGCWVL